jgi:hypothetical protein
VLRVRSAGADNAVAPQQQHDPIATKLDPIEEPEEVGGIERYHDDTSEAAVHAFEPTR